MKSTAVRVLIHAFDPILKAGVVSQLRPRPEIRLASDADERPQVSMVVTDALDDPTAHLLHRLHREADGPRTVLVASGLDDGDLIQAVEAGVVGVLRRHEATADRLVEAITGAARNEGSVPPDLLGRLLDQVGAVQRGVLGPQGLSFSGLAEREAEVLRLVADGCDTHEIATRLCYSERTVKNVLHDITSRLNLRNRSHAVAYALRQGLI